MLKKKFFYFLLVLSFENDCPNVYLKLYYLKKIWTRLSMDDDRLSEKNDERMKRNFQIFLNTLSLLIDHRVLSMVENDDGGDVDHCLDRIFDENEMNLSANSAKIFPPENDQFLFDASKSLNKHYFWFGDLLMFLLIFGCG